MQILRCRHQRRQSLTWLPPTDYGYNKARISITNAGADGSDATLRGIIMDKGLPFIGL